MTVLAKNLRRDDALSSARLKDAFDIAKTYFTQHRIIFDAAKSNFKNIPHREKQTLVGALR